MTSHPPDPAEWESPPQEMLARDGQRPAMPSAAWPGPDRRPHALAGLPGAGYQGDRYPAGSYPATGYYHGDDPAGDYLPDYPALPDYPPLSDHPSLPGYPPLSDHPSLPGYPPLSDHPSLPGYPPLSDHPSLPGYPPLSDHPSLPGYPPLSDHPSLPGYPPAPAPWPGPGQPADSHVDHDEYIRRPTRGGAPGRGTRSRARPVATEDARRAMLAYLTVPIFGCIVSLAIYLPSLRGSRWLRAHAAQALNVWLTWLLYNISALIVGGLLALDSARLALTLVLPVVAVLWLTILAYLIRAARLASRGREYALPHWLCSQIIR
jgi:uncharacterized protein